MMEIVRSHRRYRRATDALRMQGKLDGVAVVCRSRMNDDGDFPAHDALRDFRDLLSLLDGHHRATAVGPADEQPLDTGRKELDELFQRTHIQIPLFVEGGDHRRDNALQLEHLLPPSATLWDTWCL